MRKYIYILSVFLFVLNLSAMAQRREITGQVSDKDGGLPGVSVIDKTNPKNGTLTDANGRFKLFVEGNMITIKMVGYTTKDVSVQGISFVTATLSENQTDLDEVVIVGFGEKKKITLTGAVSAISGKDIKQSPSPSLQNTLAGRVTGFSSQQRSGQPGRDGASFNVRGVGSYVGSNNPLILVDDIEFTYDQFSSLNANEVESVSILKDASTTSIYGIKGANGVILVTTVRGKVGKPQITFQAEYGLNQLTRRPEYLDAYQSASIINQGEINTNALNPNPSFVRTFSDQDLELYRNGTDPYGHPNNDWTDILLKKFAPQIRGNFDITGGTEKAKYFVSIGYLNQGGQLKDYSADLNSEFYYKRYNYRSNVDVKLTKTLDVKFDVFGNVDELNTNNASANSLFSDLGRTAETAPFNYPIYNPDGSLGYSLWQRNSSGRNNNNLIGRLMYNGYSRTYSNNINLASSAVQKLDFITKGLSVKGTLAYRNLYAYSRNLQRPTSGTGFISYIYDPATEAYNFGQRDNVYRISIPTLNAPASSTNSSLTLQAILNYNRSFGDHNVTGLVLFNQNSKSFQNTADGNRYNFIPENFRGYTARLGYDYKQKYILEASGAYNGTDRFAVGKRLGFFPAGSVGWNIAEEKVFKKNLKFIDLFKARASYGLVGADGTGGTYAYLQSYTASSGTGLFGLATNNAYGLATEGTLGNDQVSWEKEKKLDIGLDIALFKRKFTASFDYFNNNRYDILTTRGTVSAVFGQNLPPVNLGKVNNKGFEVEFGFNNTIGTDWRYSVRGTYSLAKNKIVFADEAIQTYEYQTLTGQSIGSALKYNWTGEFYSVADIADPAVPKPIIGGRPGDLKYKDLNADGVIDANDRSYFGYTNLPNTTLGLTLNASYKNFSVTVLFQGATNFVASAQGAVIHHNASKALPIHLEHWTPALGNSARYPQLYTTALSQSPRDFYSDFWAIPADYVRLKTAEISYTAGTKLLSALRLKGLRFYTNGYNLFTWTKLDKLYNLDPEVLESIADLPYPPTRILNFGINVTF